MAPQFVNPYVKSNKNDANDAEAVCEAIRLEKSSNCCGAKITKASCWRARKDESRHWPEIISLHGTSLAPRYWRLNAIKQSS